MIEALGVMGRDFGVALQMLDDLTGLTSADRCHKGHEDLLAARPTWPWAWLSQHVDEVAYLRFRSLADAVLARDSHPEELAEPLQEQVRGVGFPGRPNSPPAGERAAVRRHRRAGRLRGAHARDGTTGALRWLT